jgi:GNAT superfamily N-acetyltransferase
MATAVCAVVSGGDLRRFIRLPWRLYAEESRWVAPLLSERRRHLDRARNPFFEHAEAEYFLAWRGDRPVGRISAQVDRRFNEFQGNQWGMFGFFECEHDPEIAEQLLAAARGWLGARGCDRMVGPMDFSTNHECGLLVEGHERRPQILECWHHPYYAAQLEGAGLTKVMDLLKWELDSSDREGVLPAIFELARRVEPEHGITVRHMRRRDFDAEVRRFMDVYNSAWEHNWGFVPLTEAELRAYAKELKPILDENWALVAEKDGETVAAALTLPDYNQVLAKLNGHVLPFGWLTALRARKHIDAVRVFALGVKPAYQHTGVAAALYAEHFEMASKTPQHHAEIGWVLETNTPMNRALEATGARPIKRYRLYEKAL